MKNDLKKIGLSMLTAGFILSAGTANAVTVSNDAAVDIVEPLTVTANDDMDFAKLVKPAGAGTAVLSTGGSLSFTGGVTTIGGTAAPGTVDISGDTTEMIDISVDDTTNVTGLSLSNFTANTFGGQSIDGNGDIDGASLSAGTNTLTLGATLNIDGTTVTSGTKTLSYTVEVTYN